MVTRGPCPRPQAKRPARRPPPSRGKARRRRAEEEDDEEDGTDDEDSASEAEREELEERLLREESQNEAAVLQSLDEKARQAPHLQAKVKPVTYHVAIPTYGRWRPVKDMTNKPRFKTCETPFILKHTLGFLSRQRIPTSKVTLFVANRSEAEKYRSALAGSDWQKVKIEVSVLGNKNSRNFIYRFFPAGTYVVSLDDDVERIAWKFREGITGSTLRILPPGGFQKLVYDAYWRMKAESAFLWGVNTSQNPRHMRHFGVSCKNGLVNGYLNGFICRPQLSNALLRTLTDATEDSEFSVRHYARDGILLRYRMYAGITTPYANRGGLQTKFEKTGESITAKERGVHRKKEERFGATELHRLFPKLVGPPRPRKGTRTMEVTFHPNGYPPGEGSLRKMISPAYVDGDRIEYKPNPKVKGTTSWELYEEYMKAKTVGEARSLGARGIDFAFDSNWGYLVLKGLCTTPMSRECEVHYKDVKPSGGRGLDGGKGVTLGIPRRQGELTGSTVQPRVARADGPKQVTIRVKEMSEGHKGIELPRQALVDLASRCPALRKADDDRWVKMDGPLSKVPLRILRILLHWAQTERLVYSRKAANQLYAALKELGCRQWATAVKNLEARELEQRQRGGDANWGTGSSKMGKSCTAGKFAKATARKLRKRPAGKGTQCAPGKLTKAFAPKFQKKPAGASMGRGSSSKEKMRVAGKFAKATAQKIRKKPAGAGFQGGISSQGRERVTDQVTLPPWLEIVTSSSGKKRVAFKKITKSIVRTLPKTLVSSIIELVNSDRGIKRSAGVGGKNIHHKKKARRA